MYGKKGLAVSSGPRTASKPTVRPSTLGKTAEALGVSGESLDQLVNERGGIFREMQLRVQATHDHAETRKRKAAEFELIRRADKPGEKLYLVRTDGSSPKIT